MSTGGVRPMSDQRFLVVIVSLLAAGLGALIVVGTGLALVFDRTVPMGEIGTPTDITDTIVRAMVFGAVLLAGGLGVAARLLHRQLRADAG